MHHLSQYSKSNATMLVNASLHHDFKDKSNIVWYDCFLYRLHWFYCEYVLYDKQQQ